MTSKLILKKRLGVIAGKIVSDKKFAEFFGYFCEKNHREDLRTAKRLTDAELQLFSRYCGYDMRFPIPLPLW